MNIAERLKKIRQSRQLTQKEMAEALGTNPQTWQVYESGQSVPGGKALEKLARLGFNINWLLTGEGAMKAEEPAAAQVLTVKESVAEVHDQDTALLWSIPSPSMRPHRVVGKSMGRTIQDGACVWIDTEDRDIVSGEVYAVLLALEGMVIKRLYLNGEGVRCHCDNPEFPSYCIPYGELKEPFVVGRVKWTLQPV